VLVLLAALGAAIAWGASDFSGALAQRRLGQLSAAPAMIGVSAVVLTATAAFTGSTSIAGWLWGALAGMASSVGVVLLYRAFAVGRIGIIAPVSAMITGLLPITVGLLSGERLDTVIICGVGMCFVAAVLLSASTEEGDRSFSWPSVALAVAAGIGFGGYLVALGNIPSRASLWPVASGRLAGLALLASIYGHRSVRPRGAGAYLVGAGLLDAVANIAYLVACHGPLAEIGVLSQLYPAATVLLARYVLDERLSRIHQIGVTAAVLGPTLIASGQ
jgi:uncharacterized membrane protein